MSRELHDILEAIGRGPEGAVLATVVRTEGSTYRKAGARMLALADGRTVGCVSGGCLEADLVERAKRVRATGAPESVVYDTTAPEDLVWGLGLGCNGVVEVRLERIALGSAAYVALHDEARRNPVPRLAVFGAGPDAVPLVRIAAVLGWRVTVVDARPAFARPERFPDADRVLHARPEEAVARVEVDAATSCVLMTHNYAHDLAVLATPAPYLGLLGPARRRDLLLRDLGLDHVPPRIHGPVGLDLGGQSPEEIALEIASQILQVSGIRYQGKHA
jgi:xanthine dehydrogenase accessory factor